jgi:hypothetical protein
LEVSAATLAQAIQEFIGDSPRILRYFSPEIDWQLVAVNEDSERRSEGGIQEEKRKTYIRDVTGFRAFRA